MAQRSRRKAVPRNRALQYQKVAEHFYLAARDALRLEYWTAAGVLIVHSAIAYADALCVKQAGQKSSGENHEDAVALLEEVVAGGEEKDRAVNQLRRIIEEKTKVSYLGDLYTARQAQELWKRLERFHDWAVGVLNR
ncbi:MAG: HEPN domain-containing protein [Ignavibacteriales bacterium]|nr:HEPN domain-containing protein [Ignavibacteriales bacterium]